MPKTVKIRFANGVLTPLEPLELAEAGEYRVILDDAPAVSPSDPVAVAPETDADEAAFQNALGAWRGTHDPEELIRQLYADRLVSTRPEARLWGNRHIPPGACYNKPRWSNSNGRQIPLGRKVAFLAGFYAGF